MAGVKGRSGRKSYDHEIDVKKLLDKSYSVIMQFLCDEKIPLEKKTTVAAIFLAKKIGDRFEIAVEHHLTSDQVQSIIERIRAHEIRQLS